MTKLKLTLLLGLALAAAACTSGPRVRVDQDPSADLTRYRTFGFFEHPATDRGARYSSIVTARLQQATALEMKRLGYTYAQRNPQLRVNFHLKVANQQKLRSTPSAAPGFYGYRVGYAPWRNYPYNVETVDYKAGTLAIDVVDASRQALVWQGIAEGKVTEEQMKNPGPAIDSVVGEIFDRFPGVPVD
jgi:Domain of unknown function (DUF4136)